VRFLTRASQWLARRRCLRSFLYLCAANGPPQRQRIRGIEWTTLYFSPCPIPSCPAYEPNSTDCEYSQPFRHIQYNRTASLRPIATLAMLLCRRIARCI
jgi:hypothetical protein